jgi:integrase
MKFTDIAIKSLKPTEKKYYIREAEGFALRVMPSGVKTFLFIYNHEGKRKEMNLGNYPGVDLATARRRHNDAWKLHQKGQDPAALELEAKEERRKAPTFAELVDEYMHKHVKLHKKGWNEEKQTHEDLRILERDALPAWGKRKAADISKRDVVLLLEKIVERGAPGSANGNFKVLRKLFNFAVERDILKISPCYGVKMPAPLVRKERYLTDAEIKTFWNSLDTCQVSESVKPALRLILATGQRPGEVIGMHTDEIDGVWWTIPAERSKNGRAHRIYLTKTARELIDAAVRYVKLIRELPADTTYNGYVFPCPHAAKNQPIATSAVAHAIRRNYEMPVTHKGKPVYDGQGKPVTENRLGVDFFTPHDLRRTAATHMSTLGIMDEVIDAVLNHVKTGIIRTYNLNRYDKEKQAALETWERKLNSILKGIETKIISIATRRKTSA